MSAVLRASGPDFDVDAFVASCNWEFSRVYRRGEPSGPKPTSGGKVNKRSGFNYGISDAGFHEFEEQIEDAVAFLTECGDEVRRLVAMTGPDGVTLDFGVADRDVAAQFDRFPANLVRLAGACGIGLEISRYPISSADEDEADQA